MRLNDRTLIFQPVHLLATWQGYLPASPVIGAVWRVPYVDGIPVTFDLTRAWIRVEIPGSSTIVRLQSSPPGAFSGSTITTLTIAAAANAAEITTGLGQITSGQLLRINWQAIGTTGHYTVELEGKQHLDV